MEKIILGSFAFLGLVFLIPLLGCLFGSFSGWVVGLVFEEEVIGFLRRLGADTDGLTTWQVGAAMGFFGGFLKTSIASKKN
jgi:hypothetical protein